MSCGSGSRWTGARRRLGLESNPVQRDSDRLQAKARVVLFILFVANFGLAAVIGQAAYDQEAARARLDSQTGYRAVAKVAATNVSSADPQSGATQRVVTIKWRDRDAQPHRQRLVLTKRKNVGARVAVWVDANERASLRKPPESRMFAAGLGAGVLTVFVSVFVLAAAYLTVVVLLNRRRMAAWADEWSVVEPQWRRQVL